MTISEQLKNVTVLLEKHSVSYALAGGVVASLYREEERLTRDLDFIFFSKHSESLCSEVLKELNLIPVPLTKAELEGGPLHAIKRKSTPVWMICGTSNEPSQVRVDFLLPSIPWCEKALERAVRVDFGFGKIPCLTVEDFLLSKLFSLANRSDRFKDLDDLQAIFRAKSKLDLTYLSDRMVELKLRIPQVLKKDAPTELIRL